MTFPKMVAVLTIACVSAVCIVEAQQKSDQKAASSRAGERSSRSADQRTSWRNADHLLASCVAIDTQQEIALARFAQNKIQDDDAKEFAQTLIDDHTAFLKKLQQYAPEATRDGFLTAERSSRSDRATTDRATKPATEKPSTDRSATATERTAAKPNLDQGEMPIDFLQLRREVAEQCLSNAQDLMNQKKSAEFDACFIGMQVGIHAAMQSKLEVYQRHASGEFKTVLADGLDTVNSHLKRAQELMENFESVPKTAAK